MYGFIYILSVFNPHWDAKIPLQFSPDFLIISILEKAFCLAHCEKVQDLGYPTNLRDFLKSCGDSINPDQYNKDMQKMVNKKIKEICRQIDHSSLNVKSATDVQGSICNCNS